MCGTSPAYPTARTASRPAVPSTNATKLAAGTYAAAHAASRLSSSALGASVR
jgi:hypothetical protein